MSRTTLGLWSVAALLFLVAPLGLGAFWQFIAIEALVFALYAMSFNLLLGYGGMLSFGHAAYFGLGAYGVGILMAKLSAPFWLALPAAPVVAAVSAAAVGYFSVRLTGIYFAMLTFAFQMLFFTVALKATVLTGGDDGIVGLTRPGVLVDPAVYYLFVLFITALAIGLLYRMVNAPFGQTLRAIRDNARRVQHLGVHTRAHCWLTFVIAGAFAGLAGGLFALSTGSVFPGWLDWTASATPIVMAVLGGLRVFAGPIAGAFVFVGLETVISGHTEYWPLFMGAIIIALVLLLPGGILGTRSAHGGR